MGKNRTVGCASFVRHNRSVDPQGKLITFEGPEGSGKTTQVAALAKFLKTRGFPVFTTREPGGTPIGDEIRSVLMGLKNTEMRPRTEILLFQASRAQLVEQVIRPGLADGHVVLSDRYADSTLAYQGFGYQLFKIEELKLLIAFATGGLIPDLTILLDVDVQIGLARRMKEGGWNRMDAYDCLYHERVRQGFLSMAKENPARWVVIDAGQSLNKVQKEIRQVVLSRLGVTLRD
jgi:dTMP kinase